LNVIFSLGLSPSTFPSTSTYSSLGNTYTLLT
jgi:hypothetical protein